MRVFAVSDKASPCDRPEVTPVDRVVATFGYQRATQIIGMTTWAIVRWNKRRSLGGGGGLVPARYQARFLAAAVAEGLPLTAADLIAEPWD